VCVCVCVCVRVCVCVYAGQAGGRVAARRCDACGAPRVAACEQARLQSTCADSCQQPPADLK
jgi:hypothetical protein